MSTIRILNIIRFILLIFIVIATGVGISGHIVENKDNDENYMTLWKYRDDIGAETSTDDNPCSTLRHRFRAVSAISIIGIVCYVFMLIITCIDFAKNNVDKPRAVAFTLFNIISFALILTSWAIEANFYHSDWCSGFRPKDQNFKIGYGLALLVTVWAVQIVVTILWLIVKILTDKAETKREPASSSS